MWQIIYSVCLSYLLMATGAVLASPLHKGLVNALHSLSQSSNVGSIFLGTHDLFSKGDFISVEGVPLSEMETGIEVSNGDCFYMFSSGSQYTINSRSCKDPLPFVCYRKLDNQTMNECGTFDNRYHLNQRTGSCYKVHLNPQTWFGAYKICTSEGGHLVILNDKEEAHIVKDMFPVQTDNVDMWEQFHIGLLAWGEDRTWTTIHGDRIEDVFHDWNPGQPDNAGGHQDHATLIRAGTLDDGNPNTRAKFVCEKSPDFIRFERPQQLLTTERA